MEKKRHKCMRCFEEFDCPAPDLCEGNFEVLPVDGVNFPAHSCPRLPTWDWIREYGQRWYAKGRAEGANNP